ncbi:ras-related protein Rab-30-like protein [Euroglyphus maynei]|uniref:Ras-related protein Rab-30-like protein n=1 Tax=Euroglyphus maynei TaxID=6958 RepID=A0A1Y3BVK8_EURMA|nr:ras-related protein Rab-30-like protein [Euroglyphus maynei]
MSATPIPEFKIILCGDYGVGKTSIFRRFLNDTYIDTAKLSRTQTRQSTLGLDQYSKYFEVHSSNGFRQIKIQLWDTGGLERVASITNSYYKFSEAALLVFDMSSLETFHSVSHHLLEILSMAENAKIFLIANKSDLKHQRQVSDEDIELFVEQFPKFNGFFQVSAKTNQGIQEMWSDISEKLAVGAYSAANAGAFKLHHHIYDDDNDGNVNTATSSSCCS